MLWESVSGVTTEISQLLFRRAIEHMYPPQRRYHLRGTGWDSGEFAFHTAAFGVYCVTWWPIEYQYREAVRSRDIVAMVDIGISSSYKGLGFATRGAVSHDHHKRLEKHNIQCFDQVQDFRDLGKMIAIWAIRPPIAVELTPLESALIGEQPPDYVSASHHFKRRSGLMLSQAETLVRSFKKADH
jgi:hypothetical protein